MTDPLRPEPAPDRSPSAEKWAPWWVYLIVLLGANYLRNFLLHGNQLPPPAAVMIAIGQAAVLFLIITAIWRVTRRNQ